MKSGLINFGQMELIYFRNGGLLGRRFSGIFFITINNSSLNRFTSWTSGTKIKWDIFANLVWRNHGEESSFRPGRAVQKRRDSFIIPGQPCTLSPILSVPVRYPCTGKCPQSLDARSLDSSTPRNCAHNYVLRPRADTAGRSHIASACTHNFSRLQVTGCHGMPVGVVAPERQASLVRRQQVRGRT
jgi:hypothetical protein